MVLATIVDVPVGRGLWMGGDMNPLSTIIGGWTASTILTFQTGTPIPIAMDSIQPDSPMVTNVPMSLVRGCLQELVITPRPQAEIGLQCDLLRAPPDQVAGNAPRYFSNLRSDGVHNTDLSISKEFSIREAMKLQVRGEFFNSTNTPRFALPDTLFGDSLFGVSHHTLLADRDTLRSEFASNSRSPCPCKQQALIISVLSGALLSMPRLANTPDQNWTHYVRIGAYSLQPGNADTIFVVPMPTTSSESKWITISPGVTRVS